MPDTEESPDLASTEGAAETTAEHAARLDYLERAEYETRHAQVRRADKRLLLLYGFLVAALIFMFYRTETNDRNLRDGLYDACVGRVTQAQTVNQLRQVFINSIASSTVRTPADKQATIDQLRSFLQPLEDCGTDPRP
jgi:hypothetical protein